MSETADCLWCKGDGKDHGTLGMAVIRDCPRCAGSGRVYLNSRRAMSGRRRVYQSPAPRPIPDNAPAPPAAAQTAAVQQQELTEMVQKTRRLRRGSRAKTPSPRRNRGRRRPT